MLSGFRPGEVNMLLTKSKLNQAEPAMESMGRQELKQRIQHFKGHIKLDFTDEYLDTASVEQLRHILFAAMDNERCRHL